MFHFHDYGRKGKFSLCNEKRALGYFGLGHDLPLVI